MDKSVTEIIDEIKCEFCNYFCKYSDDCDKEMEEKGEITRCCPLDKL